MLGEKGFTTKKELLEEFPRLLDEIEDDQKISFAEVCFGVNKEHEGKPAIFYHGFSVGTAQDSAFFHTKGLDELIKSLAENGVPKDVVKNIFDNARKRVDDLQAQSGQVIVREIDRRKPNDI